MRIRWEHMSRAASPQFGRACHNKCAAAMLQQPRDTAHNGAGLHVPTPLHLTPTLTPTCMGKMASMEGESMCCCRMCSRTAGVQEAGARPSPPSTCGGERPIDA